MSDLAQEQQDTAVEACPAEKPGRKKSAKAAESLAAKGPRKWEDVVPKIREMKDAGATVPEIAEKLELGYVLVNQVILQSYKMSVDTVGVFERQERARLGIEG